MSQQVVVTGGASGIGAAAVARFTARGCRVYVLDVQPVPASNFHRSGAPGLAVPAARYIRCDLADAASIDAAIAQLPPSIDAVVNVAGIARSAQANTVVAVNFLGLRHLTEGLMAEGAHGERPARLADGASIVNVASSAGRDWPTCQTVVSSLLDTADYGSGLAWLREHADAWCENPYKFSKQCAAAYTYRASAIARARGLRVNCVNPGVVETDLSPEFRQLIGSDMYDWIEQQVGRHAKPDDVAGVIEFLAVGDCAWLNGVEITVDGGYYAGIVAGAIRPEDSPSGDAHRGPSAAPEKSSRP